MRTESNLQESFIDYRQTPVAPMSMLFNPSEKNVCGQTVSHFKVLEKIGEGGMGCVYRALDLNLQRPVALKILPPHLCRKEAEKKQFLQEARLLSSLDHPYICTIHDIFETKDGTLCMVMPYYQGKTLREQMKEGEVKPGDAFSIVKQIGSGLSKAHTHGIIHQDIKPENIVVTNDNILKIVDFGIACLIHKNKAVQNRETMGTRAYMSPEQTFGCDIDHRTDIWSLGVVFYELLAGHLPFRGEYEQTIIYAIINEKPEPMTDIPLALNTIILKCLAKKPEDRYQNILEFLTDLEVFQTREKLLAERSMKIKGTKAKRFWPDVATFTLPPFFCG